MQPLKIAMVSPEFFPLAKTGGLGDITSALSKALGQLGHQVKVFLPCYQTVQNRGQIKDSGLKPLSLQIGDKNVSASLKSTAVNGNSAEIFLVDAPVYYDRPELLRDPDTGLPYPDNDERFILFCRATLEFIKQSGFQPDVIQANDWRAALVCAYLKSLYAEDRLFSQTSCLLSLNSSSPTSDPFETTNGFFPLRGELPK